MKYGQQFSSTLSQSPLGRQALENSVDYKALKKVIKKVKHELTELGLDAESLRKLLNATEDEDLVLDDGNVQWARAEYQIAGTRDHPIPRIRLMYEADEELSTSPFPESFLDSQRIVLLNDSKEALSSDEDDDTLFRSPPLTLAQQLHDTSPEDSDTPLMDGIDDIPLSVSPPVALTIPQHRKRRRRRSVVINLPTHSSFFTLLCEALTSLSHLFTTQKSHFNSSITALASSVSRLSSPSRTKNDLYAWREVFALWIEADIFEGHRENDRGEHAIDDVEKRLSWYISQLETRKSMSTMVHKESKKHLATFLDLNNRLLELKRLGLANSEATRKILKKHDKRLGLSASSEFPAFFKQELGIEESEMSGLTLVGLPSLPRVFLATLTMVLLPVIPQLDDYTCGICGEVAYKPILLICGHRYCVRCLVKMQKRGQNACPTCRAQVVLHATPKQLDKEMEDYIKLWFPKEVRLKKKEDGKEVVEELKQQMNWSPPPTEQGTEGKCLVC